MEIKVKPRYHEGFQEGDFTESSEEIVTIPNEAITIQEIFERSNIGLLRPEPGVDPDNDDLDALDLEEFNKMDLVEQHQVIHEHKEFLREMNKAHKEAVQKAEESEKEAVSSNESHGSSSRSDSASSKDE